MRKSHSTCLLLWNALYSFQSNGEKMRAKELVPIFADALGIPVETARILDRSLAEAGLREKGRGRHLPDMTRKEALTFLIACMVTTKATKAGQEVEPWLAAYGWPYEQVDATEFPSLAYIALGIEIPQHVVEEDETKALIKNRHMSTVLCRLAEQYGEPNAPLTRINLVDCLMVACDVLVAENVRPSAVKLEISVSHGWAAFTINERSSGGYSEIRFQTVDDPVSHETQINRSAVVYGDALQVLIAGTASDGELAQIR